MAGSRRLGVGFVGSGFNARFHVQGLQAVRDADVLGVWSPNGKHAEVVASGRHNPTAIVNVMRTPTRSFYVEDPDGVPVEFLRRAPA